MSLNVSKSFSCENHNSNVTLINIENLILIVILIMKDLVLNIEQFLEHRILYYLTMTLVIVIKFELIFGLMIIIFLD